jgi:hypothetical protein
VGGDYGMILAEIAAALYQCEHVNRFVLFNPVAEWPTD